jgi:hypothetical protein
MPNPVVQSVAPNHYNQGSLGIPVTIGGQNFQSGVTCSFTNGITVTSTTFVDAQTLDAVIIVPPEATTGPGSVTVTNPDGGSGTLASGFYVPAVAAADGLHGDGDLDPP